jgi:hypothetical protein
MDGAAQLGSLLQTCALWLCWDSTLVCLRWRSNIIIRGKASYSLSVRRVELVAAILEQFQLFVGRIMLIFLPMYTRLQQTLSRYDGFQTLKDLVIVFVILLARHVILQTGKAVNIPAI